MRYFIILFMLIAHSAWADVSGTLRVIDGDTFEVQGERIRLFGIDAPEIGQPCVSGSGTEIDCGTWVTRQIETRFGGQFARCEGRERDRYNRLVATCEVDGADLGREIVAAGLARAFLFYSEDYAADEKGAAVAGRGIWQFTLDDPSAFREERTSGTALTGSCIIKGNISDNGRIYHMPHNRDYDRVRINEARGERIFCSEREAQAAGWRAARN